MVSIEPKNSGSNVVDVVVGLLLSIVDGGRAEFWTIVLGLESDFNCLVLLVGAELVGLELLVTGVTVLWLMLGGLSVAIGCIRDWWAEK